MLHALASSSLGTRSLAALVVLGVAAACGGGASGSGDTSSAAGSGGSGMSTTAAAANTSPTNATGSGASTTSNTAGSGGDGAATTAGPSGTTGGATAGSATGSVTSGGAGGSGGTTTDGGGASSGGAASTTGSTASTTGSGGEPPVTWPLINGVQWADTDGNPIQAHGGGVLKVGDDYYWFGENRNPDGTFYAVSAYRSRDLRRWEHAHDVLTMNSDPGLDPANVERPKVVYNSATGKYVMWMHWENGMDYGEARAAVASSDTVDGDYTYHGSFRPFQDSGVMDHGKPGYMSRDCTLFVDDDGKGYFLSSSNENYDLHLYSLSDDYLSIEDRAALLFEGGHREAPALFKRNGVYFLLTSGATGWDPNQAQYATSTSLVGGWSNMQNVADGNTFYSQSTYVLPVEGSAGTEYLYLGDRWAGAWGGRVNDSSYVWQPITFPTSTTMSMSWSNNVRIDAATGTLLGSVDSFTFVNQKSGMLLSVDGSPTENSSDIVQNDAAAESGAVWRLNYDGEGYFRLTNAAGDKIIDVPDESTEPGTHLHLWDDNGGDHQVWRLVDIGQGAYRVINKKSGLVLGVAGGSTEAAAAVEQQVESDGHEQIWTIAVAD
ncbi:MAG TPA: RICIN domain-containing protein [Polyangiaceae bacterium]